jgi:hypothetical protein
MVMSGSSGMDSFQNEVAKHGIFTCTPILIFSVEEEEIGLDAYPRPRAY